MRIGLLTLCLGMGVAASGSAWAQYQYEGYGPPPVYPGYAPPPVVVDDGYEVAPPQLYAQPSPPRQTAPIYQAPLEPVLRPPADIGAGLSPRGPGAAPPPVPGQFASLPEEYRPEQGEQKELPPHLRRQLVNYPTREPAGTIVIDTAHTYLYLVLGGGRALRYGIGVGREGFTWSGTERISKMAEWPDWHPPPEMIERQPYLPRFMSGGEGNPLGARALYLGKTLYRIHGTNQPSTIGTFVSSGCIRLTNEDIEDLYRRVQVGTRVVVLPGGAPPVAYQPTVQDRTGPRVR
jgi:lipoprotein-anchoring transpeptidase ErfK/SrfK